MIGQVLSHYKILSKIGQGGMGEVYLAEDLNLGRTAALKILPPEVAADEERMRRFIQEAKTASSLKHPNVVPIYEIGQSAELRFIAMEYIEGQTLEAKIGGRPLPIDEALNIAIQMADALDEAHSHSIIHRDIKAVNIMITPRGQAKILDFGLSKATGPDSKEGLSAIETKTKTEPGVVLGTIRYMSPEQALGKEVDHRSDIFSFGIVLYQMVTGSLPFSGSTTSQTLNLIVNAQPEAPARLNYNLSPDFERIIRKCLEKDRDRRYQSARDLLVDLRNLKRDTDSAASGSTQIAAAPVRSRLPVLLAISLLILAAAAILLYRNLGSRSTIRSIAVLPFVNTTGDPKADYLSDGITESTINSLSQLPNIKVMARSTVFRFKGQDPIKVGRELKVDAVLAGTMNQSSERLLVSAELVNIADGSQIWGQQYDRSISDLLLLQKDISAEISDHLRLKLTGDQKEQLVKNYPTNSEAYQLYLQGRFHWNKRTPEGYRTAIQFFEQATAKDPSYAQAYSGLADCFVTDSSPFPQEVRLPKAEAAIKNALRLDPNLAEAYASLGALNSARWEWKKAETAFRRAIQLNPNYATAHQWYAENLMNFGRFDEAFREINRAMELDPLSLVINSSYGGMLLYSGQPEKALEQSKRVLQMEPTFFLARNVAIESLIELKRYDELLDLSERLSNGEANDLFIRGLREAYQQGGEKALLEYVLQQLEKNGPLYMAAVFSVKLGNKERAIELLQETYRMRDSAFLPSMAIDNRFKELRSDPRFQDIVRKMGIG